MDRAGTRNRSAEGVDFAEIEKVFVKDRINPDFDWTAFDTFSPYNQLPVSMAKATVAFVTTAGAHLPNDPPFDLRAPEGDPSFRAFPSSTRFEDLALTHRGYDIKRAQADMDVVLPLTHLRAAEAAGRIGRIAPTVFSFMGFVADTRPLLEEHAPAVAEQLRTEDVDLVLLAPT
jgi:D-proline reductase (dithiol) PrdB